LNEIEQEILKHAVVHTHSFQLWSQEMNQGRIDNEIAYLKILPTHSSNKKMFSYAKKKPVRGA